MLWIVSARRETDSTTPSRSARRDRSQALGQKRTRLGVWLRIHEGRYSHRMASLWSWRSSGSILSIASEGSILSIGSAGSILSVGSIGSVGSLLSIGSAASIASALPFASRRSLLSARSTDSCLGLPLGRRQRCAVGIGLVAAGAAFAAR